MKKKRFMTQSDLVCTICGNKTPIMRNKSYAREKNHIKTIYCFYCKKETDMKEIRECDWEGEFCYE